ncbi:putative methyltransferase [Heterostelium album PN500]|uniref:Putative methyltransferase n=1 Tax=Heterostelium pallidum (strain ATCC 26659 / Pp 5 / PN500) TaxID=670386 RepID=D3BR96_HETP5|nr:putative methyltransferase [Heterostelium album PN500]EFA75928.1 putative methyltransferase [Heterostelium album PN500]|eukprot:XP_020428062.1 putative methyltransferase [Heterostelium album PN500]
MNVNKTIMSSPPDVSAEILDDAVNIFEIESSDEEIEYGLTTYNRVEPIKNNTDITSLTVRLPQRHSLWAHLAWNAGLALSDFLDQNIDFTDKTVLELGSGAGLPCFIATLNNAKTVVMTDYPDKTLIDNLEYNRSNTLPERFTNNNRLFIYVAFSHHRPHRVEKDMNFFKIAQEEPFNFIAEKFKELKMKPMFAEDLGSEEVRKTVHFYTLKKKQQQ